MKSFKKFAVVTVLIMLPAFMATSFAQKKIMLKYNLKEGTTYRNLTKVDQEISFEANGQSMSLNQVIAMKSTVAVVDAEDKNIRLNTTMDAMRMEQSIFGMDIIYDSEIDSTKKDPMVQKVAESLDKLIGKTYGVIIDEQGNIVEYDMGEFGTNSDITNNLTSGNSYANFPDYKVAVGDSWETDITPLKDSDMNYHTKYTVLKIKKKEVTLGVETKITGNNIKEKDNKIDGTITGEMVVNPKTGWTISSDMDMEMTMELDQGGAKFPASISGTVSIQPIDN